MRNTQWYQYVIVFISIFVVGGLLPPVLTLLITYRCNLVYFSSWQDAETEFLLQFVFGSIPTGFSVLVGFLCLPGESQDKTSNIVGVAGGGGGILLNLVGIYYVHANYCMRLFRDGNVELSGIEFALLPIIGIALTLLGLILGVSVAMVTEYTQRIPHISFRTAIKLSVVTAPIMIGIAIMLGITEYLNKILLWLFLFFD